MHSAFVLVSHIDSSDEVLQFHDFRIRRITSSGDLSDVQKLLRSATLQDWVYERTYHTVPPSLVPSGFGAIPLDVEDALLLLRLFKVGDISFTEHVIRNDAGHVFRQYPLRTQASVTTTIPYRISQDECQKWDAFASRLKSCDSWKSDWFAVARRFFLYGGAIEFNPYHGEVDRIVDYNIALEAALVPESDFVSRRLRERAVQLLASADSGTTNVKSLLNSFYAFRSKIVHGAKLRDAPTELKARMQEFEKTVRELLVAALTSLPREDSSRILRLKGIYEISDSERADHAIEVMNGINDQAQVGRIVSRFHRNRFRQAINRLNVMFRRLLNWPRSTA